MQKDKEAALKVFEQSLPVGLPQPPRYLVGLARETKRLEEIRNLHNHKDEEKHLALTLQAYKIVFSEIDKLHMKSVIELKSLIGKSEKLDKFVNQ